MIVRSWGYYRIQRLISLSSPLEGRGGPFSGGRFAVFTETTVKLCFFGNCGLKNTQIRQNFLARALRALDCFPGCLVVGLQAKLQEDVSLTLQKQNVISGPLQVFV